MKEMVIPCQPQEFTNFMKKTLHFPKQQCFGAIAHQILMKENGSRKSNCHAATSGLPERLRWSGRFAH
jgi:hypothetical protein